MPNYFCRLKPKIVEKYIQNAYLLESKFDSDEFKKVLKKENIDDSYIDRRDLNSLLSHFLVQYNSFNIEVAFGLGDFLISNCEKHKNDFFLGIDYALPVIQRALLKASEKKLKNVLFFYGRAEDFFRQFFPVEMVDLIMINYPDPWPKEKHIKRRIINEKNIAYYIPFLKKGSKIMGVTDIKKLYDYHIEELEKLKYIKNIHFDYSKKPHDFYQETSLFEQKAIKNNRDLYYFMFQK